MTDIEKARIRQMFNAPTANQIIAEMEQKEAAAAATAAAAAKARKAAGPRTEAQIQDEIQRLTEQCMSGKKGDGFWNQAFANAEQWRGQCEGYARGDASNPNSLQAELLIAQGKEAKTKFSIDDALTNKIGAKSSSVLIVAGAVIVALALYLLLS